MRLAQQRAADSAAATARANAAMEAQRRATEAATAAARAAATRLRGAISRQAARVGMATSVEIPSAAARVAAAGGRGGNGGGGFRGGPPVAPPPPPPRGSGGGGRSGGSGGGQRPPDPPSGGEGASASSGANARPANSGAGGPPRSRAASPTSFYETSRVRSGSTDHVAHNAANAVRMRAELAFRAAGIMDERGKLTETAIMSSFGTGVKGESLGNKAVVTMLTKDGSRIEDWEKMKTPSVKLSTGQSVQIHFYYNSVTGKVDYGHKDYKVASQIKVPLAQRKPSETERSPNI